MSRAGLSKSKLLAFRQCAKRLWLERYKPEHAVIDEGTQFVFAQGHEVGRVARDQFTGGHLIGHDAELAQALAETDECMRSRPRAPLFEATFHHAGALVRVDVLEPVGRSDWHLREVKSTSGVKDYHVDDVAIQRWVLNGSGVRLKQQSLMHVDTSWVYEGDGDYGGLFVEQDLTQAAVDLDASVAAWVRDAYAVLRGDEPDVPMEDQCNDPYACSFQAYCDKQAAVVEFPVSMLPGNGGKALARQLREEGFLDLRDVPSDRIDHPQYSLIHRATRSGRHFLDKEAGRGFEGLRWPRAYLDFESIGLAVPRWAGTRPYQQIPFQWSCHLETQLGRLEHAEFLDISGADPRRHCATELASVLRGVPVVFVYSAAFERTRIKELAALFPDLADELLAIADRLIDLLPLVRQHYYHRDMLGSYSLKAVVPTMLAEDPYNQLDGVQGGTSAQAAYFEAVQPETDAPRRSQLAAQLRRYCQLDTWSTAVVASVLQGKTPPPRPDRKC